MAANSKVAIVTGAGTASARQSRPLCEGKDIRVALAGRRKEPLDKAVAEAGAGRAAHWAVPPTCPDAQSVRACSRRQRKLSGRLDLLFNNGGRRCTGRAGWKSSPSISGKPVVDINLTGCSCAPEASSLMKGQDPARGAHHQ